MSNNKSFIETILGPRPKECHPEPSEFHVSMCGICQPAWAWDSRTKKMRAILEAEGDTIQPILDCIAEESEGVFCDNDFDEGYNKAKADFALNLQAPIEKVLLRVAAEKAEAIDLIKSASVCIDMATTCDVAWAELAKKDLDKAEKVLAPPTGEEGKFKSQGLCDTTMTERFDAPCSCDTYEGNLGPCATFKEGGKTGYCCYCAHAKGCHEMITENAETMPPRNEGQT